ncbi:LapA family protein [Rhodococcus sp. ABRD24]|uniref:lipopolysaccharide assembly protein LapA domain-containing protein n=1 Tax=Rhodococcus sp. ABRD24 TaxID=2507582 RepID=UPI0010395E85|nr:LapA family protein [Rhodococcus sp. ABRD24]QBJ96279.1 LapA family protein [Rhodococcus sp. ABRD24]
MTTPKSGSFLSRVSPPQWAALVLAVLAIIFVAQNRNTVSISLFWVSVEAPLWLTLTIIFAIGWVAGVLTMRRRGKAG